MSRTLLVLIALASLAFGQVNVPRVGMVRYDDGTVRPVFGLPASFIIGQPTATGINAASFFNGGGIVASADRILIVNGNGTTEAEEASSANAIGAIGN